MPGFYTTKYTNLQGTSQLSLCAKDSVACVTKTGNNVGMVIELFIHSGDKYLHIGMVSLDLSNTFGRGDDVHEGNVGAAILFDEGDGIGSRAACRRARGST